MLFVLCATLGCTLSFGQLNNYKYLVIPAKFQAFKNENQFRTSTLVKYLFTNEGFNTVYSNRMPDELEENPCLGATVQLLNDSGLLQTKTRLSIKDCNGVILMTSQVGRSKTKDLEQAYREAISEAFGSFRGLNYVYEPSNEEASTTETVTVSFKDDVKTLPETVKEPEEDKTPKPTEVVAIPEETPLKGKKNSGVLYAQPIEGGFQLVDTTPQVVYILKTTSAPDVFLVSKDGKSGVVYKNEDRWYVEMDEKGGKPKELNIKF